jgi:hypothetical protein
VATHYCITLLHHTTASHYCITLLHHTTASWWPTNGHQRSCHNVRMPRFHLVLKASRPARCSPLSLCLMLPATEPSTGPAHQSHLQCIPNTTEHLIQCTTPQGQQAGTPQVCQQPTLNKQVHHRCVSCIPAEQCCWQCVLKAAVVHRYIMRQLDAWYSLLAALVVMMHTPVIATDALL